MPSGFKLSDYLVQSETTATTAAQGELITDREFERLRDSIYDVVMREINVGDIAAKLSSNRSWMVSDEIREKVEEVALRENRVISPSRLRAIQEYIVNRVTGYGPLQELLDDPTVDEIMVNGPSSIWVERGGRVEELPNLRFPHEKDLMNLVDKLVRATDRHIDESNPRVDTRIPEYRARVNIVIKPIALNGPFITIRKPRRNLYTITELIQDMGSITYQAAYFVARCVHDLRLNVIISGGTGSGKTTLLNVMSSFIPSDERIITIEDTAELQLGKRHVLSMESKAANTEGKGAITIRHLVINSLRMRPDRIVVGECRADETVDMLQAMNTGHDGSMTTVHANEAEEALFRLETMFQMSDMHFPLPAIRQQVSSAVNLVVQQSRMKDKSRKVVTIAEVQGTEETENGVNIKMQELFAFEPRGQQLDENGKLIGRLTRLTTDRRGRPVEPDNYKLRLLWKEMPRYDNAGEELLDDILRLQR